MNTHNLYVNRLINTINNLPCSGADIHERANVLCTLVNCYKPSISDEVREKTIKKAEKFIEDYFKTHSRSAA